MFTYSAFADEISPDLQTQMEVLGRYGIAYIEARGIDGKNIADYTPGQAKEIKKILDNNGFKLSALGSPIGKIHITDDFAPELKRFENMLELADIFETPYIRMFSFFMEAADAPKYRDAVLERWQQYIDAAKGHSVILLHENEKDIYGDTALRCKDLLDTLHCDYLKATFDPANFVQCGEDVWQASELLKNDIAYVHIKDAKAADGSVVPAGQGDGHVVKILTHLMQDGFNGFLSLEPHLGDFEGFADLEKQTAMVKKEAGGAEKFDVAFTALSKIITGIGGQVTC